MPEPTLPTAVPQPNAIQQGDGEDATRDFANALNDPRRWIVKKAIPVFKAHQRTDPATGKLISVDVPKLYRIAKNMQTMERQGGVPIRMTLGHTEPGKPETQQPPVSGYYRNARVQPFGPNGEPAIVVDEWLDPAYRQNRKNYPYRSAEYYDDTEQITGVALLTRDPFLDLGVVAYSADQPFIAYTKESPGAVHYSRDGIPHRGYRLVMGDNPTFYDSGSRPNPASGATFPGYHMGNRPQFRGSRPPMGVQRGGFGTTPEHLGSPADQTVNAVRQMGFDQDRMQHGYSRYDDQDDDDQYSPEDVARMNRPQDQANWDRQRQQQDMDRDRQDLDARRNRRQLPPGQQYGAAMPQQYSGPWPGPAYKKHNIGHSHPSGGAVYSNQLPRTPMNGRGRPGRYADGDMAGAAMSGDSPQTTLMELEQANEAIQNAIGALQAMLGGGMGGPGSPPPGPFPGGDDMGGGMPPGGGQMPPPGGGGPGGGMNPEDDEMIPNSRYSNQSRYRDIRYSNQSRRPSQPSGASMNRYGNQPPRGTPDRRFARYDRSGGAVPGGSTPPTTISGLPVGYQMQVDQLRYQLHQQNEALKMLYYERDQADSRECVAEIRRLASMGYDVGEYEVAELKKKSTAEERAAYLNHIATKYQRIGTEQPPPILGDPTPGPMPDGNRLATREEMEAALKMASTSTDPNAFTQALQYIRAGGGQSQPIPYGPSFIGNPGYGFNPQQAGGEWNPGQPAPSVNGFADPYPGT